MEYPEEIYHVFSDDMSGSGRRHAYNIGCARGYQVGYEAGKAETADPLEGFSNLTVAIKDNEPIDWERLDGLKVQCVKPGVGTLHWKLVRNKLRPADIPAGWWREGADSLYRSAFVYSWTSSYGWSLWVEGDIPLVRKTADQLEVGTYFLGETREKKIAEVYIGEIFDSKVVLYPPRMGTSALSASEWVVLEEHGPFPFPDTQ